NLAECMIVAFSFRFLRLLSSMVKDTLLIVLFLALASLFLVRLGCHAERFEVLLMLMALVVFAALWRSSRRCCFVWYLVQSIVKECTLVFGPLVSGSLGVLDVWSLFINSYCVITEGEFIGCVGRICGATESEVELQLYYDEVRRTFVSASILLLM
ncbi:unnamed protein product, partial [Prorocentrum cordatum]